MRLVDADWIHQNSDERFPGKKPYQEAWGLTMVDSAPTISAVPVVRCRECENYGENGDCKSLDLLIGIHSDTINYDFFPDQDFFCAYGQRKEPAHD